MSRAGPDPGFLALRGRMHARFVECLSGPPRTPKFPDLARKPALRRYRGYIRDRSRRYRLVSRAWSRLSLPPDPLRRDLALAQLLFDHGLYFDTHEYLETAWRSSSGPEKSCLQGLIQIAAGLHKLELSPGSKAGALELLAKGLNKLEAAPRLLGPETVAEMARRLEPVLAGLAAGRFSWARVPALRWARP